MRAKVKRCSRCNKRRDKEHFNRDRSKVDGLQSMCRDCQRGNYARHRDSHNERVNDYKRRNPEKRRAWRAVEMAVRRGDLSPAPCEMCGDDGRVDAHHHRGYDHPLDVQWLCRSCHVSIEPRRGAA